MSLQSAWLRRGALAWSLTPLSALYGLLSAIHRATYRCGLRAPEQLPVPVLVVGNVVAGGAGKTPVVLALVEHLRARGLQVGVVSRGYGRQVPGCREVRPDTPATEAGDEPLLIARRSGVPVFVGERRAQAARALLAAYPHTQVLVSDDGLQHHAMARDLEVCVFDDRGIGNGWLLPAGPLREPWPRPVDLVLRPPTLPQFPGHDLTRRLAAQAVRADGTRCALSQLANQPVLALAGIARPQAFFAMLEAAGVHPQRTCALPDHHDFEASPPNLPEGLAVVCTEKDAVKLWRTHPQAWCVPLQVAIAPGFWRELDQRLDARLSSNDGSETA